MRQELANHLGFHWKTSSFSERCPMKQKWLQAHFHVKGDLSHRICCWELTIVWDVQDTVHHYCKTRIVCQNHQRVLIVCMGGVWSVSKLFLYHWLSYDIVIPLAAPFWIIRSGFVLTYSTPLCYRHMNMSEPASIFHHAVKLSKVNSGKYLQYQYFLLLYNYNYRFPPSSARFTALSKPNLVKIWPRHHQCTYHFWNPTRQCHCNSG